jgi:carboxymethylenebutenolidase
MALKSEWVRYENDANAGYFCYPERAKTPLPGVVVLQEAWGVDTHIEDVTQRFANAGYAVLAPDLFAEGTERQPTFTRERLLETQTFLNEAGPLAFADAKVREAELAKRPPAQAERIAATLDALKANIGNISSFVPRLLSATSWLRSECAITKGQPIASVGFCMGGGLSALLAVSDPELAAAVIFYGMAPPLESVRAIRCPVLGIYGSLDARINAGLPAFVEAMKNEGKTFEHVMYEGAHHAFFNDMRPTYDVDASRDAFLRTLHLFRASLSPR